MSSAIRRAAVLGAGVMGSGIAAHLANAGIPTFLLDIVPPELTEEDRRKGLTRESPAFRNRFAAKGLEAALKASPPAFFSPKDARLITIGNIEDHLEWLSQADWIIEAVPERLEAKQALFAKVDAHRRPGSLISSNTSGISIRRLAEGRSVDFRLHFLGTHFFNPPRYMKLLELIPGPETLPEVMQGLAAFAERRLGKGIVFAKDTPNFIANRIAAFGLFTAMRLMVGGDYSIEEVDRLTGSAIGHPKTATFRTADLVGLDTVVHIATNIAEALSDDQERPAYTIPPFLSELVKRGWLGEKAGQGFYKRIKGTEGSEILVLDYKTMEYRQQRPVAFPSLDMVQGIEEPVERLRALAYADDRAGRYVWQLLRETLLYAADRIPEIADDIGSVDQAMKLGFGWELGPFELWDALGIKKASARMAQEGKTLPPLVTALLQSGAESFYRREAGRQYAFDLGTAEQVEISARPGIIHLQTLHEQQQVVTRNSGASLVDLGDGVACLQFHSKNNAIGPDILQMIRTSLQLCAERFDALVIGNQGRHFCVGANLMALLFEAQEENWDDIELMIRAFQDADMALKCFEKPVVAAPFSMTLGGGCEICLHTARIRAAAETYIGLVEVGVGLIPAAGGCKEMLLRSLEGIPEGAEVDLLPFFRYAFETIAFAKVSTSAKDAQRLGYLRSADTFSINQDRLLHEAKQVALGLVAQGYTPPQPRDDIKVLGTRAIAVADTQLYNMKCGGYISDHDERIARKLANVLAGGDVVPGTLVSEAHLLDLEREAFLSLCGERKSQERIQHMLKTGKPLRN
ncbi:3-hydroxyacyl-CoA dehydrogenase NAD-binding domain-containing protein [Candidatus Methylomirabilis sp.]|uniref:3-hydroxyacyl-CoA dehydrogenase/enoyl-CoA hydratase family protein n=1 Tax=Candidatus Methylomirabilis sp. TaxID=2032687 RepID=UPI002A5C48CC|nr:3-hydroxyacyl-CoA dehydrogenase NAD-binding domain-containing protein [Candidatus Methylomirabilis sp.]